MCRDPVAAVDARDAVTVRLPDFAPFLARSRNRHVADHVRLVAHPERLGPRGAPVSRSRGDAEAGVGAAMCLSHLTLTSTGSSHGPSTRRGLLRLAPAQVRVQSDGSPVLPLMVAAPPTKRFLRRHQRYEIVLRVLAGERQAHLAKEFGVSRAAVSYLLRNPWNALRTGVGRAATG